MNDKQFRRDICFLASVCLLIVVPLVCLYKSAGWTAIAVVAAFGLLILMMFLPKSAVIIYFTNHLAARKMKTNKKVETVRLTLLGAFFTAATFFIFHMTGWLLFVVFACFAALFAPFFLTEPAPMSSRSNVMTDPTFQRMPGNIYHRKE